MEKLYSRRISRTERLWLIANHILPPYANQIVVEGHGEIETQRLKDAIAVASEANPGSRLVLKGHLSFAKWVDTGITPPLFEASAGQWSGTSSEGMPGLPCELPERTGPTCCVQLIKGDPIRLVFYSHHATMDGRGTAHWVADIFKALRGEAPIGSDFDLNEMQFVNSFNKERRPLTPREQIVPVAKPIGNDPGVTWRRRRITGKFSKLLGKIAVFVAAEARKHADGTVKVGIPVDVRRHQADIRATGNLTIGINVDVTPDMTPVQVAESISGLLAENRDLMLGKVGNWIDFVPLCLMRRRIEERMNKQFETGRYYYSALLSNLGKMSLDMYSGGGFEATSIFFIPPGTEYLPFFLTSTGSGDHIELLISMPKRLANEKRIDTLIDDLVRYLESADATGVHS